MDIYNDELRREALSTQRQHDRTMGSMRDMVGRLFERGASQQQKLDLAVGGLNRRKFIQIGGLTVATAAVFAACGSNDSPEIGEGAAESDKPDDPAGTSEGKGDPNDITILRTATSIEALAVAAYDLGIKSGLVTNKAIAEAATLFKSQHAEHLELFSGTTEQMGGQAFKDPNPVVLKVLEPAIKALRTEMDVVKLAYDLEVAAAATYFNSVGEFKDLALNKNAMSVGGVEARHVAVLGSVLNDAAKPAFPASGFQTADGAVAAGTGVS